MKIVNKFQAGGQMMAAPAQDAPAADPIQELVMMMQDALQNQDCALAMSACEGFLMLVSQASAPAPMGSEPSSAPIFRKGGKAIKRK